MPLKSKVSSGPVTRRAVLASIAFPLVLGCKDANAPPPQGNCGSVLLAASGSLPPGTLAYVFLDASDSDGSDVSGIRNALSQQSVARAMASGRFVHIDLVRDCPLRVARKYEDDDFEAYLTKKGVEHSNVQVQCGIEGPPAIIAVDAVGREHDRMVEFLGCVLPGDGECASSIAKFVYRMEASK